jgi:hypothetical protein
MRPPALRSGILLGLILILGLGACSDSPTDQGSATLNGNFVGANASLGIAVDLNLTETNGIVSGTGTLTMPNPAAPAGPLLVIPGNISGTNVHPTVNLTAVSAQQVEIATFAGTFTNPTTVEGTVTVTGLAFPPVPLTITRQ